MSSSASKQIDPTIAALPVAHLQLSGRARNVAARFGTIGALIAAMETPDLRADGSAGAEIAHVVDVLLAATRTTGWAAWDTFRTSRPRSREYPEVFFASPAFDRLRPTAAKASLKQLHLTLRAINAFAAIRVHTIGDLIAAARRGIVRLGASGAKTLREARDTLGALAIGITSDGSIDWIKYATSRGFQILPKHRRIYRGSRFVRELPIIVAAAVERKFGGAGLALLRTRLLGPAVYRTTQAQVATQLNVTTAAVQEIERQLMGVLCGAAFRNEYIGCDFRFRDEFFQPLRDLAAVVARRNLRRMLPEEWYQFAFENWRVVRKDIEHQDLLLSRLVGVEIADRAWRY